MSLYRSVVSQGNILEFLLRGCHEAEAAKRFFSNALGASRTAAPRVITVARNAVYPKALHELKAARTIATGSELPQVKYHNNLVEQDHRYIPAQAFPACCSLLLLRAAW
jgi:IS6 family transposase